MAMTLRYWGAFRSREDVQYRIELLQEGVFVPEELTFAAEEAAVIEWAETDKIEPVQGSGLTLTIGSLTDRQFTDLYTIEVGTVRCDIYRNGDLYWSGTIDTELYSEPYSYLKNYLVTLTFADFAILDRLKWATKEVMSVMDVINVCLAATGINYNSISKHISTLNAGVALTLSEVYVLCDNYYDEDDQPMTLREVLDETLRPFGLRMIQKGGQIHIYDLNAAYTLLDVEQVYWMSDDAELGVDKIYNNVKVTLSPYDKPKVLDCALDHDDVLPNKDSSAVGHLVYVDDHKDGNGQPVSAEGFRIVYGEQSDLPLTLSNGAKFFRIDSEYSGSDEAGVLWGFKGGLKEPFSTYNQAPRGVFAGNSESGEVQSQAIITTPRAFVGKATSNLSDYKLKVNLQLLVDCRYNIYEQKGLHNEEGNWDRIKSRCNFGYVPILLTLRNSSGVALYHWDNRQMMLTPTFFISGRPWITGSWVAGEGSWGDAWLAYYDADNRQSESGFCGWKSNKQMIGGTLIPLPSKFKGMDEGDYLPMPPVAGYLEMQVGSGVHQFSLLPNLQRIITDVYSRIVRWVAYKEPTVEIVRKNGLPISVKDIEDSAWLNSAAEESLEIETIFGTSMQMTQAARGKLLKADLSPYQQFTRAGVTDRLERLLIGTIYSQYSSRHDTLRGTAALLPQLKIMTDANSSGRFIVLGETQDLIAETSVVNMVALSPDDYQGIDYK